MTSYTNDQPRLPGTLITLDGPGGVGKSSAATRAINLLTAAGLPVHGTQQPSRAEIGELARHGTDTYRGMSLACLCAADRHHQLDTEIKPALQEGRIVICDRYVASSLVLQGLDGLPSQIVWQLNHGAYRPDLSLILIGDPAVINAGSGPAAATAVSSGLTITANENRRSTPAPWPIYTTRDGPCRPSTAPPKIPM